MTDEIFLEGTGCECDVTLDRWLRDSLPHLPGAVRGVAANELILACREFFERSLAWRATIGPENARSGARQYWTSPYDEYSNTIQVLGVAWRGEWLEKLTQPAVLARESSRPLGWFVSDAPDAIELYPSLTADVDDALHFRVALTPKPSVDHLPRLAYIKFYDAIMDGFLARMKSHPRKPYTDAAGAAIRQERFLAAIARYAGQARQGMNASQDWAFPRFGR